MDTEQMIPLVSAFVVNLAYALAILAVGIWLAKKIANLIKAAMDKKGVDITITRFAGNIVHGALVAFVVIAALGRVGIETASFIAVLGAAGLAIGLALQGSLSNFASGVLIIVLRPFRAGDFVEVGGQAGVVEEVSLFSTKLATGDNKVIIMPNAAVLGGSIVNYSAKSERRVDFLIGVAYDADLAKTKAVLTEVASADPRVLSDRPVLVAVSELADSSVNFVVRVWVKSADYWGVYFDNLEAIKNRLDEENIGIPFPQMDVHLQPND